ncbi:MAG: hypothetical protein GPJ21_16095, partial [Microcystis aeruginosa W13-11]|nr:hypothetical protein [Microcystis aeruginosa W13-11]
FKEEWQGEEPEVYVMDAAFYTQENLSDFQYSIKWISRERARRLRVEVGSGVETGLVATSN